MKLHDCHHASVCKETKTIEKEVWETQYLGRKADLKYTLRLLDDLEPLSACGYFNVTRGTITSMVSVRYNVNQCWSEIFDVFDCSNSKD